MRSSPWGFPALSRVIAKPRYPAREKSLLLVLLPRVGGQAVSGDCAVLRTVKRPRQLGNDFFALQGITVSLRGASQQSPGTAGRWSGGACVAGAPSPCSRGSRGCWCRFGGQGWALAPEAVPAAGWAQPAPGLQHAPGGAASTAVMFLWRAFPFMGCLFCNPQVF